MAFFGSLPNLVIVLIVFGIPFVLIGILLSIFGTSLLAWVRESRARIHRRFFCPVKKMDVEVDFTPSVFASEPHDVKQCSAFGKEKISCEKKCLHD